MNFWKYKKIKSCFLCIGFFSICSYSFGQNLLLSQFNKSLEERGVNLQINYTGEIFSNISGGIERKSVYLDNIDFILNTDLQKLFSWQGASFNAYFIINNGKTPSDYSGAGQGNSNIAAYNTWKLYELWIQQNLFDRKLSLLFGLYDLNSEFDSREISSVFINPSHGIGPDFAFTGLNGPSIFPTTSLALRMRYNFTDNWNLKAAVLDGVPGNPKDPNGTYIQLNDSDGLLIAGEISYENGSEDFDEEYFKISFGGWHYTSEFENLLHSDHSGNSMFSKGNSGAYISAEKFLIAERTSNIQGLSGFMRAGFSNPSINQFDFYIGAGLRYDGLINGRDEDIIGLSIAAAHNSDDYKTKRNKQNVLVEDFEVVLELTYQMILFEWLYLQPDMQYVLNPVNAPGSQNAIVFGTRIQLLL